MIWSSGQIEKDIVVLNFWLHAEQVDQEQENDTTGFLVVHIKHDCETGFFNIIQNGLIKQVLDVGTTNGKFIPA